MNSPNPGRWAVAPAFLRDDGTRSPLACALAGGSLALFVFVACAIAVYHRTGILAFNSDDSYIYAGYVKMAFTPGAGLFSYNVGQHSAGTTGILFYYLLVMSYRLLTFVIAPGPTTLVLNTWIVSGICFTFCGAIMARTILLICRELKLTSKWTAASLLLLGIGTLCASDKFLWGEMGGMENPLSALFVTSLAAMTVTPRPNLILASALAGGLVATRPDWAPIALLVPALALARQTLPLKRRCKDLLLGYATFALTLSATVLPLRLFTGQWQPSALGARVDLHFVHSLVELNLAMQYVFVNGWGQALFASWLACIIVYHLVPSRRPIFFIPLSITLFFLMRMLLGLDNLSVRDRYVSYLWPPLAMTLVAAMAAVFYRWPAGAQQIKRWRIVLGAVVSIAAGLAVAAAGARSAVDIVCRDTDEMLQVHVRPSQWMSKNLPSHAIVEMEPAGALRTYTDFVLVDRTGLTTPDATRFHNLTGKRPEEDFHGFLLANHVQFIFDYSRPDLFEADSVQYRVIRNWTPMPRIYSLGRISLVRFLLTPGPASGEKDQ